MTEKNTTKQMERSAGHSEATRKPKHPRVSQRKELAVVTVGMVATIASFGGLLAGHQAQADQPTNATPAAQSSSTTPGSSSSGQPSNEQATTAQVPSTTPGSSSSGQSSNEQATAAQAPSAAPGSSSSEQPSKQQAPVYSPATQGSAPAQAPHAQSHGS